MHNRDQRVAKNFKASILRLVKELKRYRFIILFSLTLAALGAVLSILAPNQLSKLTDETSKGLVINETNLNTIVTHLQNSFTEEKVISVIPKILSFDPNHLNTILKDPSYSIEEKQKLQNIIELWQEEKFLQAFTSLKTLPEDMKLNLFDTTNYEGIEITKEEKMALLENIDENFSITNIPQSILTTMLTDLTIDGVVITKKDQASFLEMMPTLTQESSSSAIYQALSKSPDSIQKVIKPFMNLEKISSIVFLLIGFYCLSALFNFIEGISMTNVSNNFAMYLRQSISKKMNRLPLKYFDKHQIGDILSRVTNDVDLIAQSMNFSLSDFVSAFTLFVGSTIMMFVTNFIMALTAIFASFIGFIFMFFILGKSQKYFVERQKMLGHLNSHIEETYSGIQVVKAYNGEQLAMNEFRERNEKLYNCNRKSVFLSGLMMPMMNFIGNFGYVAVCIVGAILTMNHQISFGVIIAFISYVRLFTSPLSQIAQAMNNLQSIAAASERVFEFLDEEEMSFESHQKVLTKDQVKGNIEMKHVKFQYDGNEKPTIYDFSLKAQAGSKIAIVGPTGAGKTTLVNLLMKFYDLTGGEIEIDGISMKELSRENIHSLFTMVLQDTWLFEGTLKENIIYNQKNVTDEQIKQVCKTVGLDHFIKTLPNGYDSLLSDAESVSSGERQLLTIARGMLENAPFLILDEATSNVDTRTEELVQKAMDELMKGKTSFIIAHRLSTIKNADVILVMNEGNIIEQGTHEELMKKNGFYASLYNSQFEL